MVRPVITAYVPYNTPASTIFETRANLVKAFVRVLNAETYPVVETETDMIILFPTMHLVNPTLDVVAEVVVPTCLDHEPPVASLRKEVFHALKRTFEHCRIQCSVRLQDEDSFETNLTVRRQKSAA